MGKLLERDKTPEVTEEEMGNTNRPITGKKIEVKAS